MRTFLTTLAILVFAAPAFAQAPKPAPATLEQITPAIDGYFTQFQKEAHVPGLVWGIVRDGKLVHTGTSGVQDLEAKRPVTTDSLFRIASMSKAFTALAILKLRDEGKLTLDAPAETYVPELKNWTYPTTDSPRIRVRDLLSHVSGFVTDDPWGDRQQPMTEAEFTRILKAGVPFTRAPDTAFEYSNFGYALLGRIVTNVSGKPYNEYIMSEIMRPLGMTSTGYEVRNAPIERRAIGYRWENEAFSEEPTMPHGVFGAMGGVQTSANDYARWVAFLLSAWPARDGAETGPVRRSTVRELSQGLNFPRLVTRPGLKGSEPCRIATTYGMGFIVSQDCDLGLTLNHGGGYPGYGSQIFLMPDQGIGLFVFTNRTYSGPLRAVRNAALEIYQAGLLKGRPVTVSPALKTAYEASAATYKAGNLSPLRTRLAVNFLMDRSEADWGKELARLKTLTGECQTDAPLTATGALSGHFTWVCEKTNLEGSLLLAPTRPATIQDLHLSVTPAQ
jgi:serine-type D-Ala-D-Ala carboxypeptidase/endopeptidase